MQYKSKIPEATKQLWAAQNKALKEIGKFVVKEAKANAVVAERSIEHSIHGKKFKIKKGQLKNSIGYWVFRKEQRVLIGFRKKGWYGGFFEKGTSDIPKHPMITPAVENNIPKIREIETNTIREELNKIK